MGSLPTPARRGGLKMADRQGQRSRFGRALLVLPLLGLLAAVLPTTPATALPRPDLQFATGDWPYSVAVGDLNGDAKPDLATADWGSATVSVLLGNGDGTFQAKVAYVTGYGPRSVAIGDLNGDAKPDLATADSDSNAVSILLGKGDGTFKAKVDYPAGD